MAGLPKAWKRPTKPLSCRIVDFLYHKSALYGRVESIAVPAMPMPAPGMMTAPMMPGPPVARSSKPTIAGVFCILGLIASLLALIVALVVASLLGGMGVSLINIGGGIAVTAILGILGMVGGLMGAIFSFQRKKWMMALVGSILLLVSFHFLTGIIALILILISKKEFAN